MDLRTRAIPALEDPLARNPDLVWMSPEISLWGWGVAASFLPGTGPGRTDRLRSSFRDLLVSAQIDDEVDLAGSGPVLFFSLTFSPEAMGSVGIVPELLVGKRGDTWWQTGPGDPPPASKPAPESPDRARYAGSSVPDLMWMEAVARATRAIERGELEKVVLARDYAVWSRQPFDRHRILAKLAQRFPGCHVFQVADLVGASPELLARRRARRLDSLVLAGSAPVFEAADRDREAARVLLDSDKDKWEHELAVRSVSESLHAAGIDVRYDTSPSLLRLDNVRHLATPVTAEVPDDFDLLAAVQALHPTAAVGGTPTPAAMEAIHRLEGMERGRYAGPVGWYDTRGDGEAAIALRCAEISGARARLFAGAGIVGESLPEAELEETRLKLGAMMGALGAD